MLQLIRQTYRQMAMAVAIVIPLFPYLHSLASRRHISFRIKDIRVRVPWESFSVIYWNPVKKHSTTFSLHFKQYYCLATKVWPYLKAYTDNNAWLQQLYVLCGLSARGQGVQGRRLSRSLKNELFCLIKRELCLLLRLKSVFKKTFSVAYNI